MLTCVCVRLFTLYTRLHLLDGIAVGRGPAFVGELDLVDCYFRGAYDIHTIPWNAGLG